MEQNNTIKELQQQLEVAKDASTKIASLCDKLHKEMEEKQSNLQKEHQDFALLQNKIISVSKQVGKKIKLNIGGAVVTCTIDTLTTEKNTFFSAMFSEHFNTKPDEDGEVFIDRDPKYFGLILNHLRGVDVQAPLEKMPREELSVFFQEITYYQITSLITLVEQLAKDPNQNDEQEYFFADNSKDGLMLQHYQVNKGTLLTHGRHTWRVLIVKVAASMDVGVVSPHHQSHFNMNTPTAWGLREYGGVPHTQHKCNVGFKAGDIITCRLNLEARCLIIEVNGQHAWIFTDVVAPVHVAFSGGQGAAVKILDLEPIRTLPRNLLYQT